MSPVEHDRMHAVEDYWLYQALCKDGARMMRPPRPDFSVLDTGCGSGGMLASRGSHGVAVKVDRRYTACSSLACFAAPALASADLPYWNMSLLPVIALTRWRSRRTTPRAEAQSDFAPLPPELNAILAGLMRLEFSLISFFPLPFGAARLALARKP